MRKELLFIFILLIMISCGTSVPKKESPKKPVAISGVVDIPLAVTNDNDRIKFAINHFWDNVNFKDTLYISEKTVFEQAFADYLNILINITDHEASENGIEILLKKSEEASDSMFNYVITLYERYLYDPNSPFRNETRYIDVLNYIVKSNSLDSLSKIRPQYQLEMALKNRPGEKANDFVFTTDNGIQKSFHSVKSEYTVLFFYNLGCAMCKDVKEFIIASPMLNDKRVEIVSIYADDKKKEWQEQNNLIPKEWTNGICESIDKDKLYDVRAIPSLHLLDKNKNIILKDTPVEQIQEYLGGVL